MTSWALLSFGSMLKVKHGKSQKEVETSNGKYPILGSGGVIGRSDTSIYSKPSVLIGRKGTIDKPRFMETPFWTVDTLFFTEIFDGFDPKFIYYKFCTIDWYKYNEASGVPSLNASVIERIETLVPEFAEQQRIARVLTDADALIFSLDALIAKKKDIKQGAMQQLLTGKTRLPGFSGAWEPSTLGALERESQIKMYRGKVISKVDIQTHPGMYPIYSSSVHNNGLFGKYGLFMFDEEMISWSVDGGGHFFYRPKHKFSITNVSGYMRILDRRIDCRFLCYQLQYLHSHLIFDYTYKAHPSVIRKAYNLLLPPITEQQAITQVLVDMDAEIDALIARRRKTALIKTGMMQELLTGRTRLL